MVHCSCVFQSTYDAAGIGSIEIYVLQHPCCIFLLNILSSGAQSVKQQAKTTTHKINNKQPTENPARKTGSINKRKTFENKKPPGKIKPAGAVTPAGCEINNAR
jgi:hypothetical protein